jgi:hypothetical protein
MGVVTSGVVLVLLPILQNIFSSSLSLTVRQNKLECLPLESVFHAVNVCEQAHLSGVP